MTTVPSWLALYVRMARPALGWALGSAIASVAPWTAAIASEAPEICTVNADCVENQRCVAGQCQGRPTQRLRCHCVRIPMTPPATKRLSKFRAPLPGTPARGTILPDPTAAPYEGPEICTVDNDCQPSLRCLAGQCRWPSPERRSHHWRSSVKNAASQRRCNK